MMAVKSALPSILLEPAKVTGLPLSDELLAADPVARREHSHGQG